MAKDKVVLLNVFTKETRTFNSFTEATAFLDCGSSNFHRCLKSRGKYQSKGYRVFMESTFEKDKVTDRFFGYLLEDIFTKKKTEFRSLDELMYKLGLDYKSIKRLLNDPSYPIVHGSHRAMGVDGVKSFPELKNLKHENYFGQSPIILRTDNMGNDNPIIFNSYIGASKSAERAPGNLSNMLRKNGYFRNQDYLFELIRE